MIIFIMRHGEAEPDMSNDRQRQLTSLGEKQSRQTGIWINQTCADLGVSPELALVSPYVRAQQTFKHVSTEVTFRESKTCDDIIPPSDPEMALSYLDVLLEDRDDSQAILLVSHMPFVSYFLDYICHHHFSMLFSAGATAAVRYKPGHGPAKLAGQFLPE